MGLAVWGRRSAQSEDAGHDLSNVCIGRHQTFGVQFAERDVQGPLIRSDLTQTVQREIAVEGAVWADTGAAAGSLRGG